MGHLLTFGSSQIKKPDYFNVVASVNLAFNLQISKSKSDSQSETGFHCGLNGQLS